MAANAESSILHTAADGVSVVVCCHNSAPRLPETLARLAMQRTSARWEVIVVDNASTDGTAAVAHAVWTRYGAPVDLLVVAEPEAGLSNARKAGIRAARHDVLVFADDDNWLEPDYVELARTIMAANPAIGALGGEIHAAFDAPPPPWFGPAQSYFAVGPQAPHDGDMTTHKLHVAGAGMVLRKSAVERLQQVGFESS